MTDPNTDDDFARFRTERLAKRRAARRAPKSGIPFFGTDRKARVQVRNMEGLERSNLEALEPARSPELTEKLAAAKAEAKARTPRPAQATPRPRPRSTKALGPRTAPRSPAADAPRAAASSPPRGAPRRAAPGAAAPLVGAPAGKPAPRPCPPTAIERPRRPGLVINPPLPPRRTPAPAPAAVEAPALPPATAEAPLEAPAPLARKRPRPAPGSRDRRAELPAGAAERMEQVVQVSYHVAARAERKARFQRLNQPEDEAPQGQQRVYRQYSTSRRLRRAASRGQNAQQSG